MDYQRDYLVDRWSEYLAETGVSEDEVDDNGGVRWTYARALAHRQPRYRAIAENWGVTVSADGLAAVKSEAGLIGLVADAIAARS